MSFELSHRTVPKKRKWREDMENLWAFVVIGGPIILGLAILYATIQYRRRGRDRDRISEQSARQVREDIRREDDRRVAR